MNRKYKNSWAAY